ncbi:MAG TPA: Na/Pi cotransporter family protein [Rhizomicrobium sp.]
MNTTLTLLDLAGSIALLMWGVHMVQSGIQRGFGPNLRQLLGRALRNRLLALLSGLGVTALLQSSTATGLMVASFTASGLVDLVPALAVMLGANIGTTLIVQVLSFNISEVAPLFVLIGVIMFRRGNASRTRDLGRSFIGLGLMLLALGHLLQIVTPYEDAPSLRILLGMITTTPIVDVILAAALTWAAHSSVAVVLVIMSFAATGTVPPNAAFALVLGANIGTAINPVLEGVRSSDPADKRLPVGNLLNRVLGCVVALVLLKPIGRFLVVFEPDNARAVADFHTAFNVVLALLFLPLLTPFANLLMRWLPSRRNADDPGRTIYLDPTARESPPIALANAAREALRMTDALESMLKSAMDAVTRGDRGLISETRSMDDTLDRLNTSIKDYLTRLDSDAMSEADSRRFTQILKFITNLEHAGDVLDRNVMMMANKGLKRGQLLSEQGRDEIKAMLGRLISNVRSAAAVFISDDPRAARKLVEEKEVFRNMEAEATEAHFARLRQERLDSTETSGLHLDLIRDLKRINAHLVEGSAYPVLEEKGDLLPSRLRSV